MSQRNSGYDRIKRDSYETPEWVTHALVPHLSSVRGPIWEPAAGSGQMVSALEASGFEVIATDIASGQDFLDCHEAQYDAIVTNPPYAHARQFIEHALELTKPVLGTVAMLLRTDYDHAHGRRFLFADHNAFAKKLVLTKRIVWFDGPKAAPSFNHAWFIWDWKHAGSPAVAYGP
jgi:hypothetical protein